MAMIGYDRRVNYVPQRNVYPFLSGASLSQIAGAQSQYHATPDATSEGISMNQTSEGGEAKPKGNPNAKPFLTWIVLLGLLILLMFGAQRFGSPDQRSDFANIKLSAFNIVVIAMSAIIGGAFLRLIFTRFYVPGVSEVINT